MGVIKIGNFGNSSRLNRVSDESEEEISFSKYYVEVFENHAL
ncbi:MAG: hypothetical protein AABX94_02625 [Nanoarchaeota archaeon]